MNNRNIQLHPHKITSTENQVRLREYLMTSFFLMVIYDLLTKPIATSIISWLNSYPSQMPKDSFFGNGFGNFNFLLSTLPNANSNMAITIFALILTGLYCGLMFRIVGWLIYIPGVKSYLEDPHRKVFYSNPTGATILLSFLVTAVVIMIAYPILGMLMLSLTALYSQRDEKKE